MGDRQPPALLGHVLVFKADVVVKNAGSDLRTLTAGTDGTEGGEKALVEL